MNAAEPEPPLDPVFIRGNQRSGTSIVARALRHLGFVGFGEGHLWFDLARPFAKLRDPAYAPNLRDDSYALGAGRVDSLERHVALALDRFHRQHLGLESGRWLDKSPGEAGVSVVPQLARIFPGAQFLFVYRNGLHNVHSALHKWPDNPRIFEIQCRSWAQTMARWRDVRSGIEGRYLEVAQEDLARDPAGTARGICEFLGVPTGGESVAEMLRTTRLQTSFPDRRPGDYRYRLDWSDDRRRQFEEFCGPEMEAWGFAVDFESLDSGYDQ